MFLSADLDWMDYLASRGLIDPDTRRTLLGNRLVLIASGPDARARRRSRPASTSRACSTTAASPWPTSRPSPPGATARPRSKSLGVWSGVEDHLAQAENVRAALAFVALGEAPFGIVYATDAAAEDDVTVVGTFPEDSHPPILYPGAVTADEPPPAGRGLPRLPRLGPRRAPCSRRRAFTVIDPPADGADAG